MIEIYKGDCLNIINKINKDFIIVTDPPFNIGYKYNSYKDKMNEEQYYDMLYNLLINRKSVVIHYPEQLHKLSIKLGHSPNKVVSWVYNSNTAKQHRDIAFYNVKPNFNLIKQPYKNPNDKRIKERIAKGIGGGEIIRLVEYKPS